MAAPSKKSSCCSATVPAPPTGTPRGEIQTIDGILIYITLPSTTPLSAITSPHARAILFLSEAHGICFPHAQLLADAVADSLSCPIIAPDLFAGNAMPMVEPPGWDEEKEMRKLLVEHVPRTVDPILEKVLKWIGTDLKIAKLGAIGYCFGGRYVIRLLAEGKVDVGVVNHPSFFTLEEVEALGKAKPIKTSGVDGGEVDVQPPLAIFAAETDDIFPETKRRATEDILKKSGATWMCSTFSGVDHGFSIRPDLTTKAGVVAWQSALKGAVIWFDQYLSSAPVEI